MIDINHYKEERYEKVKPIAGTNCENGAAHESGCFTGSDAE